MHRNILLVCAVFCFVCATEAQVPPDLFPRGAVVLETKKLVVKHPNRMLVLWMLNPEKHPLDTPRDEIYTCPDQTRGSYYSGAARVSLIDLDSGKVINTIKVTSYDSEGGDLLDLPYAIRRGYYYLVTSVSRKTGEGKPTIMSLSDYNGDGKALEFVLFDAPACMGLQTTLIGYSEKQDKVIQYPLELAISEEGKRVQQTLLWADYLFSNTGKPAGNWKYEVDYRGRGGSLDKWEVRYNRSKEQFEGSVTRLADEP